MARLRKMSSCNEAAMYSLAMLYAEMGEKETAFYRLEKAAKTVASPNYFLLFDPRIAALRTDERFDRIVGRIAMPS
jgi:hypothetical protein